MGAAPASNVTAPGNATTGGNLTVPTSNATAPAGNFTGANQTGGGRTTANATGEIDTFNARGHVTSIVSGALAGETTTTGANASSPAEQYILGGDLKVDVINGEARRVQVNMSMAKPDGSDFHMHLIDNFTAAGAANETTTSHRSGAAGANVTGGNATIPGNVTAPGNETTTANFAQTSLSQDGTFKSSGMANIYSDDSMKWQNVPITIESSGRVFTINVDDEKTGNQFKGLPIYGFVTALVGEQNGNKTSLLPPLTSAAAPPIAPPTPSINATAPSVPNATTSGSVTAPSGNATTGGNSTASQAANSIGASTSSSGGGASTVVSITSGSSSKTDDAFDPNPVKAKVGDTVTWTNDDSTPHTVVSGSNGSPDGKFDSSPGLKTLITPGQTFDHKFTEAGEYPYFCQLHPNMVGTVSVS
jgi:plastocyanin